MLENAQNRRRIKLFRQLPKFRETEIERKQVEKRVCNEKDNKEHVESFENSPMVIENDDENEILAFRRKMVEKLKKVVDKERKVRKNRESDSSSENSDSSDEKYDNMEIYYETNTQYAMHKLKFIKDRDQTPSFVCTCCECMFFESSVQKIKFDKILETFRKNDPNVKKDHMRGYIINYNSEYICNTCNRYCRKGQRPPLATSNGLKFFELPQVLQKLSRLEERMVSPFIPFMQIRPLKPYSLNPQLALKGSIVNVPVNVNEMIECLPRRFDQMQCIQLALQRSLAHKSYYQHEVISPYNVINALKWLNNSPLYKKHKIEIDNEFLQFANQENLELEFIVDEDDELDDEKEKDSSTITNKQKKASENQQEKEKSQANLIENLSLHLLFEPENEFDELKNDKQSDQEKPDDSDDEIDGMVADEAMLIDQNQRIAENSILKIAPGYGKRPVSKDKEDVEELSFPKIFAGHPFNENKLSYTKRVKSESTRHDKRSRVPDRQMYMANRKQEIFIRGGINFALRKTRLSNGNPITAGDMLEEDFINERIFDDDGYGFMKKIRGSPSYWQEARKNVFAMCRQIGRPAFFLTLSANEKNWPKLIQELYRCSKHNVDKIEISEEEAMNLTDFQKTELIREDPVTCVEFFSKRSAKFMKFLSEFESVFGKYKLKDFHVRVEFQMHGSPHEHILLWFEGAPLYDILNEIETGECAAFIDKFVTCEYDENDPYVRYQMHRHSHTCYKKKGKDKKCRFNIPYAKKLILMMF